MYAALCRKPLMNPAFVPVPDAFVHLPTDLLTARVQKMLLSRQLTPLQRYLATRLGEYRTPPELPELEGLTPLAGLRRWTDTLTAANGIAFMMRSPEAVSQVTSALLVLEETLPSLEEEELFACGADLLRLLTDHYRRTGRGSVLRLMEQLQLRLPDCSGFLQTFPEEVRGPFRKSGENTDYARRLERFASGKLAADSLAIAVLKGQFTGSGRDLEAASAGLKALKRWHGLPCGAFSAEPYLAGNDPARGASLMAVCALVEACADALLVTGNPLFADTLLLLRENALPALVGEDGVYEKVCGNRLLPLEAHVPSDGELTALLKALYALRRVTFLQPDDKSLNCFFPLNGVCILRLGESRVQVNCDVRGYFRREAVWQVSSDGPAEITLNAFVSTFADGARLLLNGADPRIMGVGRFARITREAQEGWELKMQLNYSPRMEAFGRMSQSVYCGEKLLCLPLPEDTSSYAFALLSGAPLEGGTAAGEPFVKAQAVSILWPANGALTTPPPQGIVTKGTEEVFTLTLLPGVSHPARIAAFPMAEKAPREALL